MDQQQQEAADEALVECVHHFLFNRLWGWWATIAEGVRPAAFETAMSTDALSYFVHWVLMHGEAEELGAFLGRESVEEIERRINTNVDRYTMEDREDRWLVGEYWTQFRDGVNVADLRAVLEALPPDSEVRVAVNRGSAVNNADRAARDEGRQAYQRDFQRFRVDHENEETTLELERQGVTRPRIERWWQQRRELEERRNRRRQQVNANANNNPAEALS